MVVVVMYFICLPPAVTDDLTADTARKSSVVTVVQTEDRNEYSRTTLETIEARPEALPALVFLLPARETTFVDGDIHGAIVLEDHDDWQLIEFRYANTYARSSIYNAV